MTAQRTRTGSRPAPAGPRGGRCDERGFSLLELVVATFVLSIVLLFVAQGLREAQRLFVDSQRELTRGSTELATALLRRDARSAGTLASPASGWNRRPLVLVQPDGSRVVYSFDEDRLDRTVFDARDRRRSTQTVARDLRAFRWQRPLAGLLEAELVLPEPPRPPRILDRSAIRTPDPAPVTRLTVALRSRSRSGW